MSALGSLLPRPAFLFAGQGAQYVGMGGAAAADFPEIDRALAAADDALGFALSELVRRGPLDALTLTENAQPAILAIGLAHAAIAARLDAVPVVLAGHSLGEYAAWVVAGSLSAEDALRVVRIRGRAMQEAVPVGVGAMSAILSAPAEAVERLCAAVAADTGATVAVAVYNCPGNTVVSGHVEAVAEVERRVDAERIGSVQRLSVSAPFHCALLQPAAAALASALASVEVRPNALPVVPNVSAAPVLPGADPDTIRRLLVEQVVQPVRWEGCLRAAMAAGAESAALLGPGAMARGHIKRVARRFPTLAFDELQELRALTAPQEAP